MGKSLNRGSLHCAALYRKHSQGRTADTADLSTPLRSVEMTKGRAALPATVVAEQEPFFIALGRAEDP
jgi:hypothetical protein